MSRKKTPADELRQLLATDTALPPTCEAIVAARKAAGLSQTAAGQLCFVALRTWQYWESGQNRMLPAIWLCWLARLEHRRASDA